ncbi:MAG: heparinase II/III family protein [Candidatus Latescibacteria bacterium]|jgi:hypothetical protein|nr:heparinase II/III family protein [Candidatus Latescibacterota bacterium]
MNAEVKHPVFTMEFDTSLQAKEVWELDIDEARREAEVVMGIPDAILDGWNLPKACFLTVGCPHCTLEDRHRSYHMSWSPEDPDRTRCQFCGHVYPSDAHPMNRETEVMSPAGNLQRYPYHQGRDGRQYYMESQMLNIRRFWLRHQASLLAHLYGETDEEAYAQKAGGIIRRFAEVYPDIPIHGPGKLASPVIYETEILPRPASGVQPVPEICGPESLSGYEPPYPKPSTRSGLWNRFPYDEVPLTLMLAYDQVAGALDDETRSTIEDYFRDTVNYLRTYPRYLGNYDPMQAKWEIVCGRVIGEPEFVHGGVIRLQLMMQHVFFPDGMWCEGAPLYSSAVLKFICDALACAQGYSDPEGFIGIEDGVRYEDFSPDEMTDIEYHRDALRVMMTPSGHLASVYDSVGASVFEADESKKPYFDDTPPDASAPGLLWACGHAVLGAGAGDDQVQSRLQFMSSGTFSHSHSDRLGLQLFANGKEIASDIGYSQNNMRAYATSTFAHNLVMVDETGQFDGYSPAGGQLIAFGDDHDTVQFVSVRAPMAYAHLSEYRRSLVLVKVSETDAYVVDLFDVRGGSQHDWLLHGDADRDGVLASHLDLMDVDENPFASAETFRMWDSESGFTGGPGLRHPDNVKNALGLIRNVRATRPSEGWSATFLQDPDDGTGVRIHMPTTDGIEVLTGEIPSIRQAGDRNHELLRYWMPLVICRRQGEDLASRFLAVHEPYRGGSFVDAVRRDGSALIVETRGFTDVHLFGGGNDTYVSDGCYGFLRLKTGKVLAAYLVDGTRLDFGDVCIDLEEADEGTIRKVDGRRLHLSDGARLDHADRVHLSFPSGQVYAVPAERIEQEDEGCVAVLKHDPRFTLAEDGRSGRFEAFPNDAFEGEVTYRIPRCGGI